MFWYCFQTRNFIKNYRPTNSSYNYQLVYKPGSKTSYADRRSWLPEEDYFMPLPLLLLT